MCAQNGVVYKGYIEWTGDRLSYVRKYILCKCADRRIDSKNIDERNSKKRLTNYKSNN